MSAKMDEACEAYRAADKAHRKARRAEETARKRWFSTRSGSSQETAAMDSWHAASAATARVERERRAAGDKLLALVARGAK